MGPARKVLKHDIDNCCIVYVIIAYSYVTGTLLGRALVVTLPKGRM